MDMETRIEVLEKKLQEMEDKEAIREKLQLYGRMCDRMDVEMGRAIFAEDSVCDYGSNFHGSGWDMIEWMNGSHSGFTATSHQMTNMFIQLDGDKASSECYHVGVVINDEEDDEVFGNVSLSRYMDRWEKRDGEWFIVSRVVVSDLAYGIEPPFAQAKYGQYARDKSDLGYEYYQYKAK